jgi:hypothetical protein
MPRLLFRVLTLVLLSIPELLIAQRTLRLEVQGNTELPLPFSEFRVLGADSAQLYAGITDSVGRFEGAVIAVAAQILEVSAYGYDARYFPIAAGESDVVRQAKLSATSRALGGITVSSRKPLLERKADRTVFNVESSVSATGSDALEMLKRTPGLRVSDDGIAISGKSVVSVLINDKIVQMSGPELLEMIRAIPADNLARIEVITTPPAKYEAQGSAGLVNIVLKKQLKQGLNGQVTASYNQHFYNGGGLNGNFNYRREKLNVFGAANLFKGSSLDLGKIESPFPGQSQQQDQTSKVTHVFNRAQIGADYQLNPKMILGFNYTLGQGGWKYRSDERTEASFVNTGTGGIDSLLQTNGHVKDRGLRNVGNINWEWKPDTSGKKLSVDLDYFTRTGRATQDFVTGGFFADGRPTGNGSDNINAGKQKIDIRSGRIDMEWPTSFAKLSFGGKASFIHNTSDYDFAVRKGSDYLNDPQRSNVYDYKENTQAVYVSAARQWKSWDFQAGVRAENTQVRGYSVTLNQGYDNNYAKLFPTAFVQYKINDANSIGVNYSRRINRPEFWDLNPFRNYISANSYEQGNPYLQPSFTHNIELNYLLHDQFTFTAFASREAQLGTRFSTVDTLNQAIIFSKANIGNQESAGLSFSGTFKPWKWWECNVQLRGYYGAFSSSFYNASETIHYERIAWGGDITNNFVLNAKKTLLAELNGRYSSRQLSDFDVQHPIGSVNAGIKALFLKGQLIAGISMQDIFRTEFTVFENMYNGTYQWAYGDERNLHFGLTWKFGNRNVKASRERKENEDASRAG